MSYQERDYEIIDYEVFRVPMHGGELRGPAPRTLAPGEYFTCLGAAQTFGCFCEQPYPTLLAERLGLPVLNFGFAGAGPRFFLKYPVLLGYINAGRFAVVQVMSGRSEDNSVFESGGREYLQRRSGGERIGAEPAYKELLENEGPERMRAVVEETRANWVQSFSALLEAIKVPTILFWFSRRSPDLEDDYSDVVSMFGEYPHLVNRGMVEQIKPLTDDYVECVSSRGFPQRLVNRFTGESASVKHRADLGRAWEGYDLYYPSPEMQADAADELVEAGRRRADRQGPMDPIIVYGSPRSGTTYLEQILNAHPDVYISHETRVFAWLNRALALTADHEMFANHREAFVEHLRAVFPQVLRDFYRTLAPDATYWGDKNPHYAAPYNEGCLPLIDELFPRSRFIHIVRDGRDVASSLTRKRTSEGKPWVTFAQAHLTWERHVRLGRNFGRTLAPNRYFELCYEDLIADDVGQARELFSFLGIEFHPDVEAFCRGQQDERTPFMGPTRDLQNGAAASDWSTIFSLEQQARSLELIGSVLVQFGYETEASLEELRNRIAEALAAQQRGSPVT
jgi:hypothetical protein